MNPILHLTRCCTLTLFTLTVMSTHAATTVYKVKNPDGSISYSDQPQDDAEVMQVEPVPTVPAVPVNFAPANAPDEDASTAQAYRNFAIVAPGNNEAFHSPEGTVEIRVALEPTLQDGHMLEYWVDGKLHQSSQAHALQLTNVDRGTHTIQVKIVDASGVVLENRSSAFTVHRPIARPQ